MKHLLTFLLVVLTSCGMLRAQETAPFVNLTPKPKTMTVGAGSYVIPADLKVSATGLPDDMAQEVGRFVADLNGATGFNAAAVASGTAAFTVSVDKSLPEEGYTLSVTTDGVSVAASTPIGLYYAFQSVKKMLPANVMAGVKDASVTEYALPVVEIADEPRFGYRGFMLDVSRHFFTTDEVKRMLDVMSYYKLNRFHWHLSDDQGWRMEIEKYPRLTTVGATAPNSRFTDMWTKTQYWINRPYGPYFYTKDELRDVVAYAKERHIEIIPEFDMPGHFCAAMAAYPEFSCNPDGNHEVWSDGGISSDVLNVANPGAVQFAKDVLTEVMEVFPYPVVHIGGDECPTGAWEGNAECQALYSKLGMTSYRQLQSHFIKQLDEHVKASGRTLSLWDESISASGADTDMVKSTDAFIYCWTVGTADAAAKQGTALGLRCIYTPWGPYYINRRQDANDPPGAGGNGGTFDHVKRTYDTVPFSTVASKDREYCYGVQGTFWCEHVSDREYMEYLALPRLIAIAEAGWTPQDGKNFADFQKRISADTKLLDYGGYLYAPYFLLNQGGEEPKPVTPDPTKWYRLVSQASNREGLCVELLAEGSPKIGTNNAQVDRLWSNAQADENAANYPYQFWAFVPDPAGSGRYAMVCQAAPEGSVNPVPTAANNTGRWDYDRSGRHYDFIVDTDTYYGETSEGVYHYAIRSARTAEGVWMNTALGGQGFAINCYNDPADGNGGIFHFYPEGGELADDQYPAFPELGVGSMVRITNMSDDFEGSSMADTGLSSSPGHSSDPWAADAWTVIAETVNADNSHTLRLQNSVSSRSIGAVGDYTARMGRPVALGSTAADVVVRRNRDNRNYTVSVGGHGLWPVPANSLSAPGSVRAGSNVDQNAQVSPRQGAEWSVTPVQLFTYICRDESGADLGTFIRSAVIGESFSSLLPTIKNHQFESGQIDGNTITATYRRVSVSVSYVCRTPEGAIAGRVEETLPVGGEHKVSAPELPYFELLEFDGQDTTVALDKDYSFSPVYTTDAVHGVRAVGDPVTSLADGHNYLLRDAHTVRHAYRYANGARQVSGTRGAGESPYYVWQLGAKGRNFTVKNVGYGQYVPAVTTATTPVTLSKTSSSFTFTYSASNESWTIKNSGNAICWDGLESLMMVGWNSPGHPYEIFEYEVLPHYAVTVTGVDNEGVQLFSNVNYVPAGESFSLVAPVREGMAVSDIAGAEGLDKVEGNIEITVTYVPDGSGLESIVAPAGDRSVKGIYDLQGRRLNAISRPGVYIVNGAKAVIR